MYSRVSVFAKVALLGACVELAIAGMNAFPLASLGGNERRRFFRPVCFATPKDLSSRKWQNPQIFRRIRQTLCSHRKFPILLNWHAIRGRKSLGKMSRPAQPA